MMTIFSRIMDHIFPRTCTVCDCVLSGGEKHLCIACMADIPITGMHRVEHNRVEELFAGLVPIEHATSLFYYNKSSKYAAILHDLKYRNIPDIGEYLAHRLGSKLLADGFFCCIDAIVPIPLHRNKEAARGYNQAEMIARGISRLTGIPVANRVLVARRNHATQTHMHRHERWENMQGIFRVKSPIAIEGKHILLVDDVITTGATLISAAREIKHISPTTRISILTLALAND